MMGHQSEGPEFVNYFGPVLDALRQLGGSARPPEVESAIVENLNIPIEKQEETLASGGSRFRNRVHWARFYLSRAGLLDSSQRGVWSLTEKGKETVLSHQQSLKLFKDIHSKFGGNKKAELKEQDKSGEEIELEDSDYHTDLLNLLQSLPPDGFERLCQRLLRESGFQQVSVTGRSGDGGLDGHGVLQVNPLVSFYVYFQSKRYSGSVGAGAVRDFRGAMMGRADKGIIITTGTFTSDAKKEAIRDGVPPIELVDGDTLVNMFENLELGLKPRTVYEIDEEFFEEFGHVK